jgi:hypothetical protein
VHVRRACAPQEPQFVLAYIDMLYYANDEGNLRLLFERVLSSGALPQSAMKEIWVRFLEFEHTFGTGTRKRPPPFPPFPTLCLSACLRLCLHLSCCFALLLSAGGQPVLSRGFSSRKAL